MKITVKKKIIIQTYLKKWKYGDYFYCMKKEAFFQFGLAKLDSQWRYSAWIICYVFLYWHIFYILFAVHPV